MMLCMENQGNIENLIFLYETEIEDDGNFDRVGRMLNMISEVCEDGVALKLSVRLRFQQEMLK